MKIIVHIGSPKAGTTALQIGLERSQRRLLKHGVLFPVCGESGKRVDGRTLSDALCGIGDQERGAALLNAIESQIEAEKPEILFLSTEYLFRRYGFAERVVSALKRWGREVTFFCILREHSDFYRSMIQQHLKSSGILVNPLSWSADFLDALVGWSRAPGSELDVLPFKRDKFLGGCLVKEVAQKFFPRVNEFNDALAATVNNSSDPTEVTWLIQDYQLRKYPNLLNPSRMRRDDVVAFRKGLLNICNEDKIGTKPRLFDNVRQTILAKNRDEIRTLRDEWRLELSANSRTEIEEAAHDDGLIAVDRYHQIVPVSEDLLLRLLDRARGLGLLCAADALSVRKEIGDGILTGSEY